MRQTGEREGKEGGREGGNERKEGGGRRQRLRAGNVRQKGRGAPGVRAEECGDIVDPSVHRHPAPPITPVVRQKLRQRDAPLCRRHAFLLGGVARGGCGGGEPRRDAALLVVGGRESPRGGCEDSGGGGGGGSGGGSGGRRRTRDTTRRCVRPPAQAVGQEPSRASPGLVAGEAEAAGREAEVEAGHSCASTGMLEVN